MFKRIIHYLGIEKFGWLEFFMALYPILAGYGYGSFHLAFGVLFILDVLIVFRGNLKSRKCLPLTLLFVYVLFHYFIWLLVLPSVPSYFINSFISTIIYAVSVFIIAPQLDYHKFKSAINVIAIICMIGMIYHVFLLSMGQSVSPIKLPLLPDMAANTRLYQVLNRPTSFFWEPQSYATFMLVPLFFALNERKLVYAFIIAALMIVSTSTTGLVLSILMFLLALASNRTKLSTRFFIITAVLALGFFLYSSTYTMAGLEKFQNTNLEESNRIFNGFLILQNLSASDLIFGIPFANVQDAYEAGYLGSSLLVYQDGVLFLSAVWLALVGYGVIGLVLFFLPYFWIFKKDRTIYPYLACIVVGHFSNPDFIGAAYVFQIITMLVIIHRFEINKRIKHESSDSYISVR